MAPSMRRACARVLLGVALLCATAGLVAVQARPLVSDPEAVALAAGRALDDPSTRAALVPWVVDAIEQQTFGIPVPAREMAHEAVASPWFASTFEEAVAEAHAYVFSDRSVPPTIDATPLAPEIRAEVAEVDAELAALLLPDGRLSVAVPSAALPDLRGPARLVAAGPFALLAAAVLAAAATALHPDRSRPLRHFGTGVAAVGACAVALATLALPVLARSTGGSAGLVARTAAELRGELLAPASLVVAAGATLVLLAGRMAVHRPVQQQPPSAAPVTAGLALR